MILWKPNYLSIQHEKMPGACCGSAMVQFKNRESLEKVMSCSPLVVHGLMTKATTKRVMFEYVSEEFSIWIMSGKGTPDTWTCNKDPEQLVSVPWYESR